MRRYKSFTVVAATANKMALLENPGYAQTPDKGFFWEVWTSELEYIGRKNRTGWLNKSFDIPIVSPPVTDLLPDPD